MSIVDDCYVIRDLLDDIARPSVDFFRDIGVVEFIINNYYYYRKPEVESPKAIYEVEEIWDHKFLNRDGKPLLMDIMKPIVPKGTKLPVLIHVHGGALVIGDHRLGRQYAKALATRGYLVFNLNYQFATESDVCKQIDDIFAGMDYADQWMAEHLEDYDFDYNRIFMSGTSAGSYLVLYAAAMQDSKKLQEVIGYEPSRLRAKAIALHTPMIYIKRGDAVQRFLDKFIYGDRGDDQELFEYLDPEHEEVMKNLPPTFFTTGKADFLNLNPINFHKAMKEAGKKCRLLYYPDETLYHCFPEWEPHRKDSIDAIDKMCDWFEAQVSEENISEENIEEESDK